jgi:uncharacterized protein
MTKSIARLAGGCLMLLGAATLPALAAAQQTTAATPQRTIRVTGNGEIQATPDQAHIDLAVETTGSTAREAGEANAQQMDRVIRALVAAGVPREAIETRNYSLYPEYAPPEPRQAQEQPRIRGYRASNMVSVRTTELARVGSLIDTALQAGANRMDAVRFSLRNADAAQAEATRHAVERARRSAETIAAALGVRLGAVLDASTTAELVRPFPYMARADRAMAEMAPTPIQPGEQTVTATVTVVFAIDGAR